MYIPYRSLIPIHVSRDEAYEGSTAVEQDKTRKPRAAIRVLSHAWPSFLKHNMKHAWDVPGEIVVGLIDAGKGPTIPLRTRERSDL